LQRIESIKSRDGLPLDVPMMQLGWNKTEGRHAYLGEKSKVDSDLRKLNEHKYDVTEIVTYSVIISIQPLFQTIMKQIAMKKRTNRAFIKLMPEN
jgi:hypothetical protein